MGIKLEKLKSDLKLRPFGQKGWLSSNDIQCPECNRSGKFGVMPIDNAGVVHCFFCDYSTSIYKFLKTINRLDLTTNEVEVSINTKFRSILTEIEVQEEIKHKEVKLPLGIKPLMNDHYLNARKFLPQHYKLFQPCYTDSFLERELKDYIIFKIFQKGELVSWLARSRKDYQWHKENLMKAKAGEERLSLRYRNSEGTLFDRILGGYDDITENTRTVILVEGLFDKVGTDVSLSLYDSEEIRCCFTFGNKVSDNQIELLKEFKNIDTVIMLYDYGTIKQSKTYALKLSKFFDVKVGMPEDKDSDPGDMTTKQFLQVFLNLKNPIEFYISTLNTAL